MDMIYPLRCPICDKILPYKRGKICRECRLKIDYIKEPKCKKCGKAIDDNDREYCLDCMSKEHAFKNGVSLASHTGDIRNSIYRIKYNKRREYADFYTDEIVRLRKTEIYAWKPDVITVVPLHKKRRIKRGYNQAEIIGKMLSEKLNIPYEPKLLLRVKNTRPLKELGESDRRKNLKNAFLFNEKTDKKIMKKYGKHFAERFKKIVIVDDIYTTGSTIDFCGEVLLKKGASEIYFITITIGAGY